MDPLSPVSLPLDLMRSTNPEDVLPKGKALQDLEALFLHQLIKEMRKSVPESGFFGASPAQKMFQEMLDEVYAEKMAESGQLGVARLIAAQLDLQAEQAEIRESLRHLKHEEPFLERAAEVGKNRFFDLPQGSAVREFISVKEEPRSADNVSGADLGPMQR